MSLHAQALLDLHDDLICDLFAGGGGASCGIEAATGRLVDIAINHDAKAVEMHKANHPQTRHFVSDVFEIEPRLVCGDRPVGLLWASPDCTHNSKARGGKPLRDKSRKRRALAWVVTRWAGQVRPRVIALENVEEFAMWGPLVGKSDALRPSKRHRGRTFKAWVRSLKQLGYNVEWRELRACDYGAPTIRKRLFVIARCDGQPIVWPAKTHGPGLKAFRSAASCIDWTLPMCSIFATKEEAKAWAEAHGVASPIRPLAENTMRRIARGVHKFVLDNPKPYFAPVPFFTTVAHGEGSEGGQRWGSGIRDAADPITTLTCKGETALVSAFSVPRYGERPGQEPRARSIEEPAPVVVPGGNGGTLVSAHLGIYYGECDRAASLDEPLRTQGVANRFGLVASFLTQNNGGFHGENNGKSVEDPLTTILCHGQGHHGLMGVNLMTNTSGHGASGLESPCPTVTTAGNQTLVASHIQRDFGQSVGHKADDPIGTITTDRGGHCALVASFMSKFYGTGEGQAVDAAAHTITTKDRLGLVTVKVKGVPHVVTDIAMRMLSPRELFRCQGFPDSYIIDRGADGSPLTKTDQVRMCGNSVCPPLAEAIVRSNCAWLSARPAKRRMA